MDLGVDFPFEISQADEGSLKSSEYEQGLENVSTCHKRLKVEAVGFDFETVVWAFPTT